MRIRDLEIYCDTTHIPSTFEETMIQSSCFANSMFFVTLFYRILFFCKFIYFNNSSQIIFIKIYLYSKYIVIAF